MRLALERVGHAFLGRTVLDDVSLALDAHETVAIVGPSGCGKTTLLAIAAGLFDPLSGGVRRAYARHAAVFQEPRLLPWRTARENIGYGLEVRGVRRRARHAIAERLAEAVALAPEDLDKFPVELSGGMRQRVAFARALAIDPEVVFFDEPFTALDVGLRRALQDLVIGSARERGYAALFVTHDLLEAVRVAHRVIVMAHRGGRLAGMRTVADAPGWRDERTIWQTAEAWRTGDPLFAHVFGVEERA
ncbi:MAG: ATP-binding cassette domain-containing protein [Burkholderiales bacterium]|nr:ATP-binding cassette domain-containing protein [Burkholderiales bacterium]